MSDPADMLNRRARAVGASDRSTAFEGVVVGMWSTGPVYSIITESGAMEHWLAAHTEEIEPGAGEVAVRRADAATHYITVESPQDVCVLNRGDHGEVESMTADPQYFPSTAWSMALDRVMENADAMMCDLMYLNDEATGQVCANAIGWVLHDDDDDPRGNGLEWRMVVLVHTAEGIATVCEDCHPENMYGSGASFARHDREREAIEATKARLARGTH